jgi:hypothetical protein
VDVQVRGQLVVQPQGKAPRQLPLIAKGSLHYDERTAESVALRYYHKAEANLLIGGNSLAPALDARRRLIALDLSAPRPTLYSPQGPLTREQLELIDVQGNTAVLERLLPGRSVKVGESWHDSPDALASLLALDAVHQSEVSSTLVKIEQNLAVVELVGQLSGSTGGVPSDISLSATYTFDLSARRMASLALAIDEKRAISSAEPGFEVAARIEVTIDALERSEALGDNELAALSREPAGSALLLSHAAGDAGLRLLHSRRWRLMYENDATAVFRLIERGDVLAQCNLHRLPELPPGKRPTLDEFKADVQKSLGESFGKIEEAAGDTTAAGCRRLRVTVSGVISEVPIRWIYFHLADESGRQASCIFTLRQENLQQLADDDLRITGSLAPADRPKRATGSPSTGSPQPAEPRTSAKPR